MDKNKQMEKPDTSKVYIETADGNAHPVSFQLVQSIYNEITGKKEQLSKSIDSAFHIEMSDLQQLNVKLEQFKEQYNIVNGNSTITVLYENDTKEIYSSFERFSLINTSSTAPIEIIIIKFNLLILLPKTQSPQSYQVEIRIRSLAQYVINKSEKNELKKIEKIYTAYFEVLYVDYIVGQSIMDLIDRWFESLTTNNLSSTTKFIQNNLNELKDYFELLFITTGGILLYILIAIYIPKNTPTETHSILKLLLVGAIAIIHSIFIATRLSNLLVKSVKKIYPISYIKLNKGDARIIKNFKTLRRSGLIRGLGTLFLSIAAGVISSLIAWQITN